MSDDFTKWDSLLKKYSKIYGVPWRWMKVIILNESSNGTNKKVLAGLANPSDVEGSKSSDGKSWGLMQITLPTAKGLTGRVVSAEELNNADFNVQLSAQLLKQLIARFGYSFHDVMRAYNGGPNFGALTLPYYTKSLANLAVVQAKQPGEELEIA